MLLLDSIDPFVLPLLPWICLLTFLLMLFSFFLCRKEIAQSLRNIDGLTWAILLLIFSIGLYLRVAISPSAHAVWPDESLYMQAGKEFAMNGAVDLHHFKSAGWPFVISLLFLSFGAKVSIVFLAVKMLGALTILAVFLLSYEALQSRRVALISALILSLLPLHIEWSTTAEAIVPSVFFITIAMWCAMLCYHAHLKKNQKGNSKSSSPSGSRLLWLAIFCVSFASFFRQEGFFIVIVFVLGLLIFRSERTARALPLFSWVRSHILALAILMLLSLPHAIHVLEFQGSQDWMAIDTQGKQSGDNWSVQNLINHSIAHGPGILFYKSSLLIAPFFFLGIFFLLRAHKKEAFFFLSWFALLWLIYFSSWWQTLAGPQRFYLSFYPIVCFFASYGLISLQRSLFKAQSWLSQAALFAAIILLISTLLPSALAKKDIDDAYVLESSLPDLIAPDIAQACALWSANPSIFEATHPHPLPFLGNVIADPTLKIGKSCVLFIEDAYCDNSLFPRNHEWEFCSAIHKRFELKKMKEYRLSEESLRSFTLYAVFDRQ